MHNHATWPKVTGHHSMRKKNSSSTLLLPYVHFNGFQTSSSCRSTKKKKDHCRYIQGQSNGIYWTWFSNSGMTVLTCFTPKPSRVLSSGKTFALHTQLGLREQYEVRQNNITILNNCNKLTHPEPILKHFN